MNARRNRPPQTLAPSMRPETKTTAAAARDVGNRMDTSVVQLHCNHFKDPCELSTVLKTFWSEDRFSVEMRNDIYTIRIYNSTSSKNKHEIEDRNPTMLENLRTG
ncbi:hypothetical protein F5Y19DRAFT_346823 [Xylariaceae sp. FL1651]|nr:hypothetical protein F5Y19DRAFT_346823 [Xylariaceae sp. FL1651]